MKKNLIMFAILGLSGLSFAQEAPKDMVCSVKSGNLNTCVDISSLQHTSKYKVAPHKIYKVKQENGNFKFSDSYSKGAEEIEVNTEKMMQRVNFLDKK